MNIQESIRRILREETELPSYIRRRVNMEELDDLVLDVKELIDSDYDKTDAIYDTIRQFIATKNHLNLIMKQNGNIGILIVT
jgi:vacuolar-type H+-ATPase catalytic subunit A/Vma1